MDEAALRACIASIEKQLAGQKVWLYVWIVLVIIGCSGELVSVIREFREDLNDWKKARPRRFAWIPEKPSKNWMIFDVIAVFIVVLGITGELTIDFKSNELETKLRDANGSLILLLEQEAGDAKTSADRAAKNAAKAKGDAGDAETKAGSAVTTAGNASAVASAATKSANEAGTKAAELDGKITLASNQLVDLDVRRKELEAYLHNVAVCNAPRLIQGFTSSSGSYVENLKPFAGFTATLAVVDDPEAQFAAAQLTRALNDAGINVKSVDEPIKGWIAPGLTVESFSPVRPNIEDFRSIQESRNVGLAIVLFLHDWNWQAVLRPSVAPHAADLSAKGIRISIGRYPPVEPVRPPALAMVDEQMKKQEKLMKELHELHFTERTKNLTPEQRRVAKAEKEKFEASDLVLGKIFEEEHGEVQPCKSINSPM